MTTAVVAPPEGLSRRKILTIVGGLIAGMFLAVLDQTVSGAALPTIVGELHGVGRMAWVILSYSLASSIMLPISGKLGDIFGHKRLFLGSIGIFMVGSLISAIASSMTVLIIGRAIQGLGGGGLMIIAMSVMTHLAPPSEMRKFTPLFGLTFGLSSVLGPLIGGYFTDIGHWRWVFGLNIPVGVIALVLVALLVPKLPGAAVRKKFDLAGTSLLTLTSTAIVLAMSWGGSQYAWDSPTIHLLIGGAILCGLAFVYVEWAAEDPIMPWVLFQNRNFVIVTVAGLVFGLVMMGTLSYLPTYLQMVTGASPTSSGVYMLPMVVGMIIVSFLMSRVKRYKWGPLTGMAIMGIGLFHLAGMTPTMPLWYILSYLGMMGVGMGMCMQVLMLVVRNETTLALAGVANATNVYFRTMGMTLGASFIGVLFASNLKDQIAQRLPGMPLGTGGVNSFTPAVISALPSGVRDAIIASYNDALTPIFLLVVPLVAIAFVILLFLKEVPIRETLDHESAVALA